MQKADFCEELHRKLGRKGKIPHPFKFSEINYKINVKRVFICKTYLTMRVKLSFPRSED